MPIVHFKPVYVEGKAKAKKGFILKNI